MAVKAQGPLKIRAATGFIRGLSVSVLAVSGGLSTGLSADTSLESTTSAETNGQQRLEELDTEYDTRYVDQLTLPRVAAPLASSVSLEATAPAGRNTQDNINPPRGANVQANTGFFPSLTISADRRSNPARVAGGENDTDNSVRIGLDLRYRGLVNDRHIYELNASALSESFDTFTSLDSDNNQIGAAITLDMSEKLKTDLYASYADLEDSRGITATRDLDIDEPNDKFTDKTVGGRITLGRRTNPIQILLGANHSEIDFTNNDQGQRDRVDERIFAGLYLNLSPKTSFFWNGAQTDVDYKENVSGEYDSENNEIVFGVGWEPSFSTSVLLQAGSIEKSFKDSNFEDQDGDSYLGKFTWLPSRFTSLNLYMSQTFEESVNLNSPVIESALSGINLTHSFTEAFRGQLYLNYIEDNLVNVRQDEIADYGIGLFYDIRRWLRLGATWARTERNSTDPIADYDSDLFSLTLTLKPKINNTFGDYNIHTREDLRGIE